MRKGRGITTVELVVVISITTILIAIALPSVGKAREDGRITLCGMHMRQIAKANLMYIDQNNGAMITASISQKVTAASGGAAGSRFWASDLSAGGYLPANTDLDAPQTNTTQETVFYCPDGILKENPVDAASEQSVYSGNCPRSEVNAWYRKSEAATLYTDRVVVSTWYQLNAGRISAQSRVDAPGTPAGGASAFVQWDRNPKDAFNGSETLALPGGFGRNISQIHVPGKFVLLVEASGPSWDANGFGGSVQPDYPSGASLSEVATAGHPFRLSGRHGDALNKGYDGYTDMAYFDGHVAKNSTVPYSMSRNCFVAPSGIVNGFMPPTVGDTLFYLQSQP